MKYLLSYTPLAGLERIMMEPPLAGPRGGGKRGFRYTREMCDCTLCAVRPCPGITECPCFDEYLEAGAWSYNQLLRRLNGSIQHRRLHERLWLLSQTPELQPWRDEAHRLRLLRLWQTGVINRSSKSDYLAALFLLAADYDGQPHIDEDALSDPEKTGDELFALLMAAFVIRAYGLPELTEGERNAY